MLTVRWLRSSPEEGAMRRTMLPLAFLVVGCQATDSARLEANNQAVVLAMIEGLDAQDWTVLDSLVTPDARFYGPGQAEPFTAGQLKEIIPAWYAAFPDYVHNVQDAFAKDDKVVVQCTPSGTQHAEFMGIPNTGAHFEDGWLGVYRVAEGKIVEGWWQEDYLWMYQQLGLELRPAESES
jgi:predicted ester cyclase